MRQPWIQSEHDTLLRLVTAEVQHKRFRDSIDWDSIASAFNAVHHNQLQSIHEPLAISEIKRSGALQQSRGGTLADLLSSTNTTGRIGGMRRAAALRIQAGKFPRIKAVVSAAPKQKKGRKASVGNAGNDVAGDSEVFDDTEENDDFVDGMDEASWEAGEDHPPGPKRFGNGSGGGPSGDGGMGGSLPHGGTLIST